MKKKLITILFLCAGLFLCAQEITVLQPVRTVEEEAQKQTQRLERELMLDSLQRDTVYQINLLFCHERRLASASRIESAKRMQRYNTMLQGVLSEQQFNRFLQLQQQTTARRQVMTRVVTVADSIRVKRYNSNSEVPDTSTVDGDR